MAKNGSETFELNASFPFTERLRLEKDIDLRATWTDGVKQLARIRKLSSNGKADSPPTPGRGVFIAYLPGTCWLVKSSGRPMTVSGRTAGPWPELVQNVEANRRWAVGVINNNEIAPLRVRTLEGKAIYFDCPEKRVTEKRGINYTNQIPGSTVLQFEALQELGHTEMSTTDIEDQARSMWAEWNNHDDLLWNSQHFALRLAFLIVNDQSQAQSEDTVRTLHRTLWLKQSHILDTVFTRKHLACMAGFALCGFATLGLGVFGFWAYAGYNIYTSNEALPEAMSKAVDLAQHIPRLAPLHHLE